MAAKKKTNAQVANPTSKFAPLVIDGNTYQLCWDFRAIKQAEVAAGVDLFLSLELTNLNARQYSGLLYAATRKAHPEMSLIQTDELIRIDTLATIYAAITEAWIASVPKKKEGEGADEAPLAQE
jgi:hypothetical protein